MVHVYAWPIDAWPRVSSPTRITMVDGTVSQHINSTIISSHRTRQGRGEMIRDPRVLRLLCTETYVSGKKYLSTRYMYVHLVLTVFNDSPYCSRSRSYRTFIVVAKRSKTYKNIIKLKSLIKYGLPLKTLPNNVNKDNLIWNKYLLFNFIFWSNIPYIMTRTRILDLAWIRPCSKTYCIKNINHVHYNP